MDNTVPDNPPQSPQEQEIEHRVKELLGSPPQDPNPAPIEPEKPIEVEKPQPQPQPQPTIQLETQEQPQGAPPVGSVISPTQPQFSEPIPSPEVPLDTQSMPQEQTGSEVGANAAQETEESIAAQDKEIDQAFEPVKPSGGKIRRLLRAWWGSKKARWITIAGLFVIILALLLTPASRYFLLNNFGVRSSASVTVLDDSTQLPLRNVSVKLANASGLTDENGTVKLYHIKLGRTHLDIGKRAFADVNQNITIGWGSNPLGSFKIRAVGDQFSFLIKDWLSGQPVTKVEATSGDASAFSDANGKIVLTIDPSEVKDNMSVVIKADTYRDQTVALDTTTKVEQPVAMVPARKEVFISNRSGKYDLYSIDIDGKNERLVLAGTGLERDDMVLVPHPTGEVAALVSTRVNVRNSDGFLLSTLTLVNVQDNSTFEVAQSERIQIVGWVGDRLVFVQIAAGASASDPSRYRLMSYNYKTADKLQLASANLFNDVILVGGNIYYAMSDPQSGAKVGLIKSNADGTIKTTLLDKEVWNIFRVSYDTLDLATAGQDWYEYKIGNSNAVKLSESPANPKSRIYINSPDDLHSLWIDQRDGKGVLLDYNQAAATDKILQTQGGLIYPVRWLNGTTFIYRVHTDQETADYAMSVNGGTARKIKDVYNASGIDRWYYY